MRADGAVSGDESVEAFAREVARVGRVRLRGDDGREVKVARYTWRGTTRVFAEWAAHFGVTSEALALAVARAKIPAGRARAPRAKVPRVPVTRVVVPRRPDGVARNGAGFRTRATCVECYGFPTQVRGFDRCAACAGRYRRAHGIVTHAPNKLAVSERVAAWLGGACRVDVRLPRAGGGRAPLVYRYDGHDLTVYDWARRFGVRPDWLRRAWSKARQKQGETNGKEDDESQAGVARDARTG